MAFTCEECGWWADVNEVCICGYSGRPTTRHDSCMAWKTPIITNADRIRSMTDEELADFLCDIGECNRRCPAKIGDCIFSDSTCRGAWNDWLRREGE